MSHKSERYALDNHPIDSDPSSYGSTPEEQRERIQACRDHQAMLRDQTTDYYNEVGWNHGSQEVIRPVHEDSVVRQFDQMLNALEE